MRGDVRTRNVYVCTQHKGISLSPGSLIEGKKQAALQILLFVVEIFSPLLSQTAAAKNVFFLHGTLKLFCAEISMPILGNCLGWQKGSSSLLRVDYGSRLNAKFASSGQVGRPQRENETSGCGQQASSVLLV